MRNVLCISLISFILLGCGKGRQVSVNVSPTQRGEDDVSAEKSQFCAFIETQGDYQLNMDQLKCTVSGRPAAASLDYMPMVFSVRSLGNGLGALELTFAHGGAGSKMVLKFPRNPGADDVAYSGVQCSNGVVNGHMVRTLSRSCPGDVSFCSYTFTQSDDSYFIEMTRIVNEKTYACRASLERALKTSLVN